MLVNTELSLIVADLTDGNKVEAEICRRSMYEFVKRSWHLIEPHTVFVDNWHIIAVCDYLEACYYGDIHELVINIPPRYMKSLLVNVFFPSWVWTIAPEKKFMCITYAHNLAIRDSLLMRNLITSEWYIERFGIRLARDQNEKTQYKNTDSGYRMSFGLDGGITGQGADYLLIDDPVKTSDASNERELERVNDIFDNTISSRLNDPKTGVKILIMQRLNNDDLTGHLLKRKNWEALILPTEYEVEPRFTSTIGFEDPRTEEDELLWKGRFGEKEVAHQKSYMSTLAISGQLQQRPTPMSGYIFKKTWFGNRVANTDIIARFISCDTAQAVTDSAAYSSFAVGELMADYRLFIREIHRDKLEFPQLQYEIEKLANLYKFKLKRIIIESKSSGISVIQSIKQTSERWIGDMVVAFNPTTNKVDRASKAAVWCENGSVLLPTPTEEFPWLFDFEDELFTFPQSDYKDQVDCFSQLILYCSHFLAEGLFARREINVVDSSRERLLELAEF